MERTTGIGECGRPRGRAGCRAGRSARSCRSRRVRWRVAASWACGLSTLAAAPPPYLSTFDQQRYFTYPHRTGFFDGGRKIVLGQIDGRGKSSLWVQSIQGGTSRKIGSFTLPAGRDFIYYDIAEDRWLLAASDTRSVWTIDLRQASPTPRRLYTAPPGNSLDDLVSVRYDGSTILAAYRPTGANSPTTVVSIKVSDGTVTRLFSKNFRANHLQYSPNDPAWFGFSRDEGNIDRIWGYHHALRRPGNCSGTSGPRAAASCGSAMRSGAATGSRSWRSPTAPAPARLRGLYLVQPDGSSRLVQSGDDYLHCNIRRDGRFAVVDTFGGDVILIDMAGNAAPRQIAHTRFAAHPRHPHPHFTPDGTKVVYNDTNASKRVRVALVPIA